MLKIDELESDEEEEFQRNPHMNVVFYAHYLSFIDEDDFDIRDKLLELIQKNAMAPIYEKMCLNCSWASESDALLTQLHLQNLTDNLQLEKELAEAQKLGLAEVNEVILKKIDYASKIGDKYEAVKCFTFLHFPTMPHGRLLKAHFHMVRIGIFFQNVILMKNQLKLIESLLSVKGDWHKRNRFKVYEGIYFIKIRDFKSACDRFVDCISSFNCNEVMRYSAFIRYTVHLSMMILPRQILKKKIIDNSRVISSLDVDSQTVEFMMSLYDCNYSKFFQELDVVEWRMLGDFFFFPHHKYYSREMRIVAYKQIMDSYRCLSLSYMANKFDINEEYLERDIVRAINSRRLCCKINHLTRSIEMVRPAQKNHLFLKVIEQGDILLNKVQKLSQVIEI